MSRCPICKRTDALVPQVIAHPEGDVYYKACRLCGGEFADEHDVTKTNRAGQDVMAVQLINEWGNYDGDV